MRPLLHPALVNGRTGDPALYIETLFERRAILFDLGDIAALSPRKVRRLEHVLVSHTHIDHFIGFDRLPRLLVGREKTLRLYGPEGFIDQIEHKLAGYRWNLVERYAVDLVFEVMEIAASGETRNTRFRFKQAFAREDLEARPLTDNVVCREPAFHVSTAVLEHRGPCLGFAVAEAAHVNVWKNKLAERGLAVGLWLRELKQAVLEGRPNDFTVRVAAGEEMPLAALRDLVTVTPGQKIAYVTDVADTPDNRAANVRRVEPFHFSPRYEGEDASMIAEVMVAFSGT